MAALKLNLPANFSSTDNAKTWVQDHMQDLIGIINGCQELLRPANTVEILAKADDSLALERQKT